MAEPSLRPTQEQTGLPVAGMDPLPDFVLPTGVNPLALLTALLSESAYPVQICSPQGRSLYVNPAFVRSFGSAPAPEYNVLEDAVFAAAGLDRQIASAFAGTALDLPSFWYDPRADGVAPAGRGNRVFLSLRAVPLHDAAGDVALVLFQFEDLTALQSALEQKERLLAERDAVIQQSPLGIVIADANGHVTLENPAAVRIFAGDSPVHSMDERVQYTGFHPDGRPYEVDDWALGRAIRQGETIEAEEVEIERLDGSRGTLFGSAAPLHDAHGHVIGGVALFADISRLKELERLREQFMSVAAHELRTPLTALLGHAQILERSLATASAPSDRLRLGAVSVLQAAVRLQRLINQLLEISRLDQGRLHLRPAPADLAPLLPKVVEELRFRAPEITFEIAAPATLPGTWDAVRIEQVLFNLLDNAVRYGPPGGTIRVRVEQRGAEALVTIEDEGPGLPETDLERLFERDYRAPRRRGVASPGFGLGLFLAYEIVRLHGGAMQAANRPGGGLRVSFSLPLSGPAA